MSLRTSLLGLPLVVGLLGISGCGAAPDEEAAPELLGNAGEAIKDGYADTADTGAVGVGIFQQGALIGICTGSLIAPNVVLTAHHCVADVLNYDPVLGIVCSKTSFSADYPPVAVAVTTSATMGMAKDTSYHRVSEIITQTGTKLFCGNDQAILILADTIDPSEAKLLVPRVDSEIAKKDEYYAVGYGATQDDPSGPGAGIRRRRDQLFVACPGALCPDYLKAAIKPVEFVGDQGLCEGDSGSPALDMEGRVIGVSSRGGAQCKTPVYSDVFGVGEWVKATTIHGATVGGYPAPAWTTGFPTDPQLNTPVGDACKQASDCASNDCRAGIGAGAAYCTRPCTEAATCPDGYVCDATTSNVCVRKPAPLVPSRGDAVQSGGCSISAGDDPTKPVPWLTGTVVLAALALLRRRAS
ncbi:MAG: trypsin-like serine protease [Byssovorax sp.]